MRLILLPVVTMVLTGCPSAGQDAPDQATIDRVAPAISADSAYQHIRTQVAFGPRVPGKEGHAKQLAWMIEYLKQRADTLVVQPFRHTTTMGTTLQLTNLIAKFNPDATDRVLLVAHWDTRPTADEERDASKRGQPIEGANDGASGTALLLEIANILSKNKAPIGVDLLFVDGEDYAPNNMFLGAKHFAANLGGYKPLYGVLVDMIADANPVYPIEDNSQRSAPEVVDRVWRMAQELGYSNYFKRNNQGGIEDDHVPLNMAGVRTIDIIDFDYPHWHKTSDVLANTSPLGLGIVGAVLLELIYRGG